MSPITEIIPASHAEATEFLVELARALAANGSTADRIERALSTAAERIGIKAEFFATPTSVFASIGSGTLNATKLLRVESADINLDRLAGLDSILQRFSAREITIAQARAEIEDTLCSPSPWPAWAGVMSFAVSAGCAVLFFGGRWAEIAVALLGGLSVGLLGLLIDRVRRLLRVFEFLAGFLVALIAYAAAAVWVPLNTETVIVAGLIVLMPGLSLTIAVSEVATRHLLSGTARLVGAAASLASIAFGVASGSHLTRQVIGALTGPAPVSNPGTGVTAEPLGPLGPIAQWTALACAPIALAVLFKASVRDLPAIAAIAIVGFLSARELGELFGSELGAGIAAILVGLLANARAIWANRPVAVCAMPGIILLVPGSIGFRSLSAFLDQQAVHGLETAVLAVTIALALATGLLLANVLLPPKRAL